MVAAVSTAGCPAAPSTSTITPSAGPSSLGKRVRSTVTLSPGLASLACGSRTMMGSRMERPSGCTIQRRPSCCKVPAKRVRPRDTTSSTRPVGPSVAAPRPVSRQLRCRRISATRTRSPVMAPPTSPCEMNTSPSRESLSGFRYAWPFCVTKMRPTISSSCLGRRMRPSSSISMRCSLVRRPMASSKAQRWSLSTRRRLATASGCTGRSPAWERSCRIRSMKRRGIEGVYGWRCARERAITCRSSSCRRKGCRWRRRCLPSRLRRSCRARCPVRRGSTPRGRAGCRAGHPRSA